MASLANGDIAYPLQVAVDCTFRRRRTSSTALLQCGGQVNNLSARICSLELTTQPPPLHPGMWAELRIDWPAKLQGGVALQFHIWGLVASVDGSRVVVAIRRYQFETRGKTSDRFAPNPSRASG